MAEEEDDDDDDIKELEPPKVLGDVLESVAGALFVDSQMNLEVVWSRFYPFFKPLIGKSTIICNDVVHSLQKFVLLVDFIGLCMHSKRLALSDEYATLIIFFQISLKHKVLQFIQYKNC